MADLSESRPIQFGLKSGLILLFVWGLLLTFYPQLLWLLGGHVTRYRVSVVVLPATVVVTSLLLGCRLGQASRRWTRTTGVQSLLWSLIIVSFLACSYAIWTRHRIVHEWFLYGDPAWPRPWPYPDHAISALHDWLDERNPPPPGFIKIHGEVYTVWGFADVVVIALLAVTAALFGVANSALPRKVAESQLAAWLWKRTKEDAFAGIVHRLNRRAD